MASRAAVDWSRVTSKLGLGKETLQTLSSFRKRNEDARRAINALREQRTDIDLSQYRNLRNQDVVAQAEKLLKEFKPVDYDVSAQHKAIDAFRSKAVEAAEATTTKIEAELAELKKTLDNIEGARPFEDLTLDEIEKAKPQLGKTVETMIEKGRFDVPGYKERFPDLNVM